MEITWKDSFFDNEISIHPNIKEEYDFIGSMFFSRSTLFRLIYDNISFDWLTEFRINKIEDYLYSNDTTIQKLIISLLLNAKTIGFEFELRVILDLFPISFKIKNVERIYYIYFSNGGKNFTDTIYNCTGIMPNKGIIQTQYNKWLRNDDLLSIEKHIRITGYKPIFEKDLIKNKIKLYNQHSYSTKHNVGPLWLEKIIKGMN